MGFSIFKPKNRTVNMVINDHSIRFAELKHTNPLSVLKWNERFLPPGIISEGKIIDAETLATILEECIDEWKLQKRSIQFIVPDPLVIIRKLSIPADIEDDEIKGYLYLELGSTIHLPFEDPVFDIHLLPEDEKKKEVLLFAAPELQVKEYMNVLSGLNLNPVAADISPLSFYRLYHHLDLGKPKETLFTVQSDITGVTMCIFDGVVPLVMRHSTLPYNADEWEIKRDPNSELTFHYHGDQVELSLQCDDILREMNMLLDFYRYSLKKQKNDVDKIVVYGDHPINKMLVENAAGRFEIPITTFANEAKSIDGGVPANLLLTLGLGLKEVH